MEWTIRQVGQQLREGKVTCVGLLDHYLSRIEALEPQIRAWVLVDARRARAEAAERDQELKRGYDRGALHGIPMGIKDIIDVFDWPTSCGSSLWKQAYARQDAPIVASLRHAGAVLIGKTVTTQFASFDPPPTRNPWNPGRTPGGSSSGSAAALAAGMCLATLGSQTGGSITRPASYCGVPACKPTYGLVPLEGILPLAPTMDHPGPLATCIADVEIVLRTIAKPGVWDTGLASPEASPPPVLGRLRGLFDRLAQKPVRDMTDRFCAKLVQQGASVVEVTLPVRFEEVLQHHRVIMAVEAAAYHGPRLARHPDDYGPRIRSLVEEGLNTPAPAYHLALQQQSQLRDEMAELFHQVDALIAPATTSTAPDAATTGDPAFNSPWSFTGLPVVSLPTEVADDGMPLGVQLIGPALGEPDLFTQATWVESQLGPRRQPALPS
ncbi:MAG: amidase [Gemmataceae bacterium]